MTKTDIDMAMELLGALVLTDHGDRWGALATEVQRADARAILSDDGPRRHWLGRARGYSKTTDVAALLIVLLLTLPYGSECAAAAADADQAAILVRRMRWLLSRTKALTDAFEVTARRVSCKRSGSFVEVLAADGASAWGLLPSVVVLDEFPMWHDSQNARELFDALVTALPKVPGSRLIIMGTAGDPAGWAAKVREQALADPDNWRVSEPPGPPPWTSAADVEVERRRLPEFMLRRLFGNEWCASQDRLTALDDLRAAITLDGFTEPRPGMHYCIGVDLGVKHDRTVAAVCHRETAVVALDRMEVWAGTRANPVELRLVEEWLTEAARRYNGAEIRIDPWQGIGMAQRLRSSGLRVREYAFSSQSVSRLAVTLHTMIRDHRLALPDDEALVDELGNVRLRETSPGVLRLDHDPDRHDDRAIALGLAVHTLVERRESADWSHLFYSIRCPACEATVPESSVQCPKCSAPLEPPTPTPPSENVWASVYGTTKALERATSGGAANAGQRRGWFR